MKSSHELWIHCFIVFVILSYAHRVAKARNAAILRRDLFADGRYDPYNRPHGMGSQMNDTSRKVPIELYLLVLHIYDVEESTGTLVVNGWFLASWPDFRLIWNPEEYGQLNHLHMARESIWVPEVALLNNAEAMSINNCGDTQIHVSSGGIVHWGAPVTLKIMCPIDHTLYPFDELQCTIVMGLWSELVLHYTLNVYHLPKDIELEYLEVTSKENPQWQLVAQNQQVRNKTWSCCSDVPIPYFEVDLNLRRRAPLYRFLLPTPIALSILLVLSVFWLPPGSPERFTCAGMAMAIQIASLLYLGLTVPAGARGTPAIVVVCGSALATSASLVVVSVILAGLGLDRKRIPRGLEFFTNCGTWSRIVWFGVPKFQIPSVEQLLSKARFSRMDQEYTEPLDNDKVEMGSDINVEDAPKNSVSKEVPTEGLTLGAAIDRLCFILYCFIYAVIAISAWI